MADYGISTLGVKVGYAQESTAGTRPTTGYTQLTRINSIGEISLDSEAIDASALEDYITRYVEGRANASETIEIVINRTNETITEWESLLSADSALTGGKATWLEIINPDLTKADFIRVGLPTKLPVPGRDQNGLETMTLNLVVKDWDLAAVVSF